MGVLNECAAITSSNKDIPGDGGGGSVGEGSDSSVRIYRRVDDRTNTSATILTLPSSDIITTTTNSARRASDTPTRSGGSCRRNDDDVMNDNDIEEDDDDDDEPSEFKLLQLPCDLTLHDLMNASSTFIVGRSSTNTATDSPDDRQYGSLMGEGRYQACFIVEGTCHHLHDDDDADDGASCAYDAEIGGGSGGKSYSLSHVETTNALIIVPPVSQQPCTSNDKYGTSCTTITATATPTTTTTTTTAQRDGEEEEDNYKIKTAKTNLIQMNARLTNPSTFLELKRVYLNRQLLLFIIMKDANNYRLKYTTTSNTSNKIMEHGTAREQHQKLGFTVLELSLKLQVSQMEVLDSLHDIDAFAMIISTTSSSTTTTTTTSGVNKNLVLRNTNNDNTSTSTAIAIATGKYIIRYTILPEEMIREVTIAILAVLTENTEWDIAATAHNDISIHTIVDATMQIWNPPSSASATTAKDHNDVNDEDDDEFNNMYAHLFPKEDVIRHCLHSFSLIPKNKTTRRRRRRRESLQLNTNRCDDCVDNKRNKEDTATTSRIQFDVNKIATFLAHELFIMRPDSSPWRQDEFLKEWHGKMPGVGAEFEPSLDLLHGIALSSKDESLDATGDGAECFQENQIYYLHYFPEMKMTMDSKSRFEKLFQFRELWSEDDIAHYVTPLVASKVEGGISRAELMLRYTRAIVDDAGKKMYRRR